MCDELISEYSKWVEYDGRLHRWFRFGGSGSIEPCYYNIGIFLRHRKVPASEMDEESGELLFDSPNRTIFDVMTNDDRLFTGVAALKYVFKMMDMCLIDLEKCGERDRARKYEKAALWIEGALFAREKAECYRRFIDEKGLSTDSFDAEFEALDYKQQELFFSLFEKNRLFSCENLRVVNLCSRDELELAAENHARNLTSRDWWLTLTETFKKRHI